MERFDNKIWKQSSDEHENFQKHRYLTILKLKIAVNQKTYFQFHC